MVKPIKTIRDYVSSEVEQPVNPWIEKNKIRERLRRREVSRNEPESRKRARRVVRQAMRQGDLVPQPCEHICSNGEVCGKTKSIEAHHTSYAFGDELKVVWLCKRHHQLESMKAWKEARRKKWETT